jgi:hypothetical protein
MDHEAMGQGTADGIEWEDDMVAVNRLTTIATMHWRFLDRTTGTDNPAMAFLSRIWSGRTPCWSAPARPSTSCSMCPIPGCGWPIATSPSTGRAA